MKMIYKFETWYKDRITHTRYFRAFDKFIMEYFKGKNVVGAEIGVLAGYHANCLLHNIDNISDMYLIDPYLNYKGYDHQYVKKGLNVYCAEAKSRLRWCGDRAIFIASKFQDAIGSLPKELDFVYYDIGIRNESDFLKDFFDLYYPLVKHGGVIGGYNFDASHLDIPCVVMKFVKDNNLKLEGADKDWWIVKGLHKGKI